MNIGKGVKYCCLTLRPILVRKQKNVVPNYANLVLQNEDLVSLNNVLFEQHISGKYFMKSALKIWLIDMHNQIPESDGNF
jgi:hypothetical protein